MRVCMSLCRLVGLTTTEGSGPGSYTKVSGRIHSQITCAYKIRGEGKAETVDSIMVITFGSHS